MTFADWMAESRTRFEEEPPTTAAKGSLQAFARGGFRRLGRYFGQSIWELGEWDVLVVLDACRYDIMREVAPEYDLGPVDSYWSNASCSIDWILRNFKPYPHHRERTGYVTGNPFADHDDDDARSADLGHETMGLFMPLYRDHWQPIDGGPVETIPPAVLTDHAIDAWRRREELDIDRLVIHYMQPHQPYRSRPEWSGVNRNLKNLVADRTKDGTCAWQQCRMGNIDQNDLWDAYRDNLRWVLDDVVGRLLNNIDGTALLTADHGNAMGEWGEWAHPPGALGPAVRRVPKVTVDCWDKKTVAPDVNSNPTGANDVNDQLKALGYV